MKQFATKLGILLVLGVVFVFANQPVLAASCTGSCVLRAEGCTSPMRAESALSCDDGTPEGKDKVCCVSSASSIPPPGTGTLNSAGSNSPASLTNTSATSTSGTYKNLEKIPGFNPTDSLVQYLQNLYQFGIAIAAFLAVAMIAIGAFIYVVSSAGNAGKMADGKDMITNAIYGLILAMLTYLILVTINPDFLSGTLTGSKIEPGYSNNGAGGAGNIPNIAIGCNEQTDAMLNQSASSYGVDSSSMKALIKCGEGCNPNKAPDGGCGYGQLMPANRAWCGISGSAEETCKKVIDDPQLGMNCVGKLLGQDMLRRCGKDIRQIASCYNTGKPNNCANSTRNYCDRVANCQ